MSKLKTPQEKKQTSLLRDSRNVYGENDKASRKGIPLARQQGHQSSRRDVKEALSGISGEMPEEEITSVEVDALAREVKRRRQRFKKTPDAPLAGVLRERATPSPPPWEGGDWWRAYRERFKRRKPKP